MPAHDRTPEVIGQLLPHGFESFQVSFGRTVGDFDLAGLAAAVGRVIAAFPIADPSADQRHRRLRQPAHEP